MAALSWNKWADIFVDFGRELYIPWQINKGCILYKDIAHLCGAFSQYLNALLFKIFGASLRTLVFFNLCLIALLTFLIYRIFHKITDRLTATVTALTFLLLFAFSQYVGIANYNFVCPYSHETAHGVILSFLAIYLFMIYLTQGRSLWLGLIGIILGIVFLTRAEIFAAVFPAVFCGLFWAAIIKKPPFKQIFKLFGIFFLGFSLPILGFLIYFWQHMPFAGALSAVLNNYRIIFSSSLALNPFARRGFGFDAPLENFNKLLFFSIWYLSITALLLFVSWLINRLKNKKARIAISILSFLAIIKLSAVAYNKISWLDIFRPLPLIMFTLSIYLFFRVLRLRKDYQQARNFIVAFVLTLFGFFLLFKMILNTRVYHYGFTLALPASLLLAAIFVYYLPLLSKRLSANAGWTRWAGLLLIGLCLFHYLNLSRWIYSFKTYPVGSGSNMMLSFNPQVSDMGVVMNDAIKKIEEITKEGETFIVAPEGIMLNYLTGHRYPSSFYDFTPSTIEMFGEDKILESLRKNPPDYFIITEKDTTEHGGRYFGQDFGKRIFEWIENNYKPVYLAGSPPLSGQGFGILISKRVSKQ